MQDLTKHLQEAIHLNTQRMPLYGELTDGKSISFSKRLIGYERLALKGAWIFDRIGDRYQKKGIPYIKAEFIDMALTPIFSKHYPLDVDYQIPLKKINIKDFSQAINIQIKKRNFEAIVKTCNLWLQQLDNQIHVYCMLRHVIESLRRIAFLIPIHQKKCSDLSLKFPLKYSIILLRTHYFILNKTKIFDEAVSPIQNEGVPFIFQDVPAIDLSIE